MLFLSDAAIRYAVEKCNEKPGYRVGIAVMSVNYLECVQNTLFEFSSEYNDVVFRNTIGTAGVEFKNGSFIRVFTASENARGMKYHLLITDTTIPRDIMQSVLMPTEIIEWFEYCNGLYHDRNWM